MCITMKKHKQHTGVLRSKISYDFGDQLKHDLRNELQISLWYYLYEKTQTK